MKYTYFITILVLSYFGGMAQNCPAGFHLNAFQPSDEVTLYTCTEIKPGLGVQRVFYGAANLTSDELNISFTKFVETTCGKVIKQRGETYLKPGAFVGSGSFYGELTFEVQVWEEDCNINTNRIRSAGFADFQFENLSQKKRDEEEKQRQEAQRR
jgi:hypothetical protein